MSEAPDRIWADGNAEWDSGSWGRDKQYDEDVEYTRTDLVRAQIEAAVKRTLEGAAEHLSMFAEPGVMLDYSLDDEIKAIRALDPAQFIDGDKQ